MKGQQRNYVVLLITAKAGPESWVVPGFFTHYFSIITTFL